MVVRYNNKNVVQQQYINNNLQKKNSSSLQTPEGLTTANKRFLESLGFQLTKQKREK